jgi:hypothetical protein
MEMGFQIRIDTISAPSYAATWRMWRGYVEARKLVELTKLPETVILSAQNGVSPTTVVAKDLVSNFQAEFLRPLPRPSE